MKARIPKERELVLLYHLQSATERGDQVLSALQLVGIESKQIDQTMLLETVGYCAEIDGFHSNGLIYQGEQPPDEFLVMRGITEKRLNQILLALKEQGIDQIDLKAMVTQTNQNWSFIKLFEEVSNEHRMLTTR